MHINFWCSCDIICGCDNDDNKVSFAFIVDTKFLFQMILHLPTTGCTLCFVQQHYDITTCPYKDKVALWVCRGHKLFVAVFILHQVQCFIGYDLAEQFSKKLQLLYFSQAYFDWTFLYRPVNLESKTVSWLSEPLLVRWCVSGIQ